MKLVRTLPKVLKFLPSDKAQDARNFVQGLQYWLGGNSENLQNFLLTLVQAYVPALKVRYAGNTAGSTASTEVVQHLYFTVLQAAVRTYWS